MLSSSVFSMAGTAGLLAGVLQVAGYVVYIRALHGSTIRPNPTTWAIFAFDTLLLAVLEAVAGATPGLLILPFACAAGCIYIALFLAHSGRLRWPDDRADSIALVVSIFIALGYAVCLVISLLDWGPAGLLFWSAIGFLVLSNLNTFVGFFPLIREMISDPDTEKPAAWAIWSLAYAMLALATWFEVGLDPKGLVLYLYPLTCGGLHVVVVFIALRHARQRSSALDPAPMALPPE